jgi:hypothetical protein
VLTEDPHCPSGSDALKIEGTIAGGTIADTRTTNINAGYENIGMPMFNTGPTLGQPGDSELTLTLTWANALFNGQAGPITGGSLTLPPNHPDAGAQFCVTGGEVGFVDGGSEDKAFKFAITDVKAGADCSGAASSVDVRGCLQ